MPGSGLAATVRGEVPLPRSLRHLWLALPLVALLRGPGGLSAQEPPPAKRVVEVVAEVDGDGLYKAVEFPAGERWLTWAIEVPPEARALLVIVNAQADVDLFLRHGQPMDDYRRDPDHRATGPQGSELLLVDEASKPPLRPGTWFLDVARQAGAEVPPFDLTITTRMVPAAAWARRARQARLAGELEDALRDCERALQVDAREDEAWAERAQVRAAQGQRAEASADHARAVELDPERLRGVTDVAASSTWSLPLQAGVRHRGTFRIRIPPDGQRLRVSASDAGSDVDLFLREGLPMEEPRRDADHSRVSWRRDEQLWLERQDAPRPLSPGEWWLTVEARPAREAATLELAIELDPPVDPARDPRWWYDRALMHKEAHQPEAALRALTLGQQLDPQDPHLQLARAEALKELERWKEGLQAYQRVMALDPRFPGVSAVLLGRAVCLRESGQHQAALRDLDELERLLPRQAEVAYQRGLVHLAERRGEEALAELGRAVELEPTHWRALLARAQARASRGERDAAREDHDLALRLAFKLVLAHEQIDGLVDGSRALPLSFPSGRQRRCYLLLVKPDVFTLTVDLRGLDPVQMRLRWGLPPHQGQADYATYGPGNKRLVLSRDSIPSLRPGTWYLELVRDQAGSSLTGELSLRLASEEK